MSLLAKHAIIKEDKSNIITMGTIAQKEKAKNPKIINATIGMLYNEEGKLLTFKAVNKVLSLLSDEEKYSYASTPGNPSFQNALKHWIFQEHESEILKKMKCSIMATPGGTGALSNTFTNYLNPGDKILLPSYMWGNYKQLAYESFSYYETYELFTSTGEFNIDNLYSKMVDVKKSQERIVLLINDPCQNPTGYCMTKEEWEKVVSIINELSSDGTPIILIHDIAYIDYDYRGMEYSRDILRLFKDFNESVLAILAFSGSKTLGLYGVRIGAQVALSKKSINIDEFAQAAKFSSRCKWSNATNLGMNIISRIMSSQKLETEFKIELVSAQELLAKRALTFLEECFKINLVTLPFRCGFFITIPCKNPLQVYQKLVEKGIHIIPLDDVLRVTISAISIQECKILPAIIKEAMENNN